jgi:hypothetical protein
VENYPVTIAAAAINTYWEANEIDDWSYLVWLRSISGGLAGARDVDVRPEIDGVTNDRRYESVIPFGGALPPLDDDLPLNVAFDHEARVLLHNTNALAAKANYQARVVWEIWNYRTADKIAQGVSEDALTDDDRRLITKYDLRQKVAAGELPMAYPEGPLLYQVVGDHIDAAMAISEVPIIERSIPAGYKGILRYLWARRPVANLADLTLNVYVDRRLFLQVYPYCMPEWNTVTRHIPALDLWIPAVEHLRVTVQSTTGHVNVMAMALMEVRKMTLADKISWGLVNNKKITSDEERTIISDYNLEDHVKAGLYQLLVPLKA